MATLVTPGPTLDTWQATLTCAHCLSVWSVGVKDLQSFDNKPGLFYVCEVCLNPIPVEVPPFIQATVTTGATMVKTVFVIEPVLEGEPIKEGGAPIEDAL